MVDMVEVSSSSACAHDSFLSLFIQRINGLQSGFDKVSLIYTLSFMIYSAAQVDSFENESKY